MAPIINDVTTDLNNPPEFVKASIRPFPPALKKIVSEGYPDLKTLELKDKSPAAAFALASSAAKKMNRWEITLEDEATGIIEVRLTTYYSDLTVIQVKAA